MGPTLVAPRCVGISHMNDLSVSTREPWPWCTVQVSNMPLPADASNPLGRSPPEAHRNTVGWLQVHHRGATIHFHYTLTLGGNPALVKMTRPESAALELQTHIPACKPWIYWLLTFTMVLRVRFYKTWQNTAKTTNAVFLFFSHHQWTDLTSSQCHTDLNDLTSMSKNRPIPMAHFRKPRQIQNAKKYHVWYAY